MGRLYLVQLDGKIYSCHNCHSHLATDSDLIAKTFHCRNGKAYLFKAVVNVSLGHSEERVMMTGLHTVADIYCNCCRYILGWKYEAAYDKDQKYKEGKFILERKMIDADDNAAAASPSASAGCTSDGEE